MLYDTSVNMQSPDASMAISSMDVSMMSLGAQQNLKEEDTFGMEELGSCLEDLDPQVVFQTGSNYSHTDEVVLMEIEGRLVRLRTLTSIIAGDQAELHLLQQQLTDIHAMAADSLTSIDSTTGPHGLPETDMAWLLTEWGCQIMLATCIRDWANLALVWVNDALHELDAFDDKVVESMDNLRGRRGDIKNSNRTSLQSSNSGSSSVDQVISAMQNFRLDEEMELVLPQRPAFPDLDTGFPFGFLSHEQEEFNQRAKGIQALGISLAKTDRMTTESWV